MVEGAEGIPKAEIGQEGGDLWGRYQETRELPEFIEKEEGLEAMRYVLEEMLGLQGEEGGFEVEDVLKYDQKDYSLDRQGAAVFRSRLNREVFADLKSGEEFFEVGFEEGLERYEKVGLVRRFLPQVLKPGEREQVWVRNIEKVLGKAEEVARVQALEGLARESYSEGLGKLVEEGKFSRNLQEIVLGEKEVGRGDVVEIAEKMARYSMVKNYDKKFMKEEREVLGKIRRERGEAFRELKPEVSRGRYRELIGKRFDLSFEFRDERERVEFLKEMSWEIWRFGKDTYTDEVGLRFDQEGFEEEDARVLYELVGDDFSKYFLRTREGTNASMVSRVLGMTRDERAIGDLLSYVGIYGIGHSTEVATRSAIKIAEKPLSEEKLEKEVENLSYWQQAVVEWSRTPEHPFKKDWMGLGLVLSGNIVEIDKLLVNERFWELASELGMDLGEKEEEGHWQFFRRGFQQDVEVEVYQKTRKKMEEILGKKENSKKVLEMMFEDENLKWWEEAEGFLKGLAHGRDEKGGFMVPRIFSEALELSDEAESKLLSLYETDELQEGGYAREAMMRTLFTFGQKGERGRKIFESLLGKMEVGDEDVRRLRRLERRLGFFELFEKDWVELEFGEKRLREMTEKVDEIFTSELSDVFELEEEGFVVEGELLEEILNNGSVEVMGNMLSVYAEREEYGAMETTKEIGRRVLRGEFEEWKRDLSSLEMDGWVVEEEVEKGWFESQEVVRKVLSEEAKRSMESILEVVQANAEDARRHLEDSFPDLDVSEGCINNLREIREGLVKKLRDPETPGKEKRDLGMSKSLVDKKLAMLEGLRYFLNLEAEQVDMDKLREKLEKMTGKMGGLEGAEQSVSDLENIYSVFEEAPETDYVKAYGVDDLESLLKHGEEPVSTCQSWRDGSFVECLPATVADGDKRLIKVEDEHGRLVGRSLMKLSRLGKGEGFEPIVYVEPVYSLEGSEEVYGAVLELAAKKARDVGGKLVVPWNHKRAGKYKGILKEKEGKGFMVEGERVPVEEVDRVEVYLPQSRNRSIYSDMFGGKVKYFNRMTSLSNVFVLG